MLEELVRLHLGDVTLNNEYLWNPRLFKGRVFMVLNRPGARGHTVKLWRSVAIDGVAGGGHPQNPGQVPRRGCLCTLMTVPLPPCRTPHCGKNRGVAEHCRNTLTCRSQQGTATRPLLSGGHSRALRTGNRWAVLRALGSRADSLAASLLCKNAHQATRAPADATPERLQMPSRRATRGLSAMAPS